MKPKIVHLDFCSLEFYEHYMVCVINEGEMIDIEKSNRIAVEGDKFFTGQKFVYLTHRKYSYSVDPGIYKYTSMVDNLVGFGVVSDNPISVASAKVEKNFLKNKAFKIFDNMKDAELWVKELICLEANKKEKHS